MTIASPADPASGQSWTLGRMAFQLSEDMEAYVLACSVSYGASGAALVAETAALGDPAVMMLAKEEYALLRFLAGALGCTRALDVGTFTGLSALAFAEGMGPDGRVVSIDRHREWVEIAKRHWKSAGVLDRIDVRQGEAIDVLAELAGASEDLFDIVFLDVDKARIHDYFRATLDLLSPKGVVIVDNTVWHGWVLEPGRRDPDTEGLRKFNEAIARDPTLEVVLLPVGDGLTLIRRR
jgi:predicted O-methyltransferase YrrM